MILCSHSPAYGISAYEQPNYNQKLHKKNLNSDFFKNYHVNIADCISDCVHKVVTGQLTLLGMSLFLLFHNWNAGFLN